MSGGRAKRILLLTGIGVVVVGLVGAGVVFAQSPGSARPDAKPLKVETAVVTRGDLTEEVRAQGTLAFASLREMGTTLSGTVTAITGVGTPVGAGQELFRVDDLPVVLMHGELPAWRSFESGMPAGRDVLQLEQNLKVLGLFDREPDTKFDWNTEAAVKKWQKSLVLAQTGIIEHGRVIFSVGDVRIQSQKAAIGDESGAELVSVTGTQKLVVAYIDPAQRGHAPVDASVTVLLPGAVSTTGTVRALGAPEEREGTNGKALKIPVTITLDEPEVAADFENVSVSLLLAQTRASDVLLIPVGSLLALPGGGFAVEVVTEASTSSATPTPLVAVELGAFANGLVVVAGGELAEGTKIVVAK